jgi:hypothetical protein
MTASPELELLEALFAADAERAASLFAGPPSIASPHAEDVTSREGLEALAKAWPGTFGVEPGVPVAQRARHAAGGRAVSETLVDVDGPYGRVTLPIAIIGDLAGDDRLTAARVYYAERWVTGDVGIRTSPWPPGRYERIVTPDDVSDVNAEYLAAVTAWDSEAIMKVFGSPCYVEFGPLRIEDRDRIRRLYEHFFGDELKLIFPTVTDDGTSCVVEWTTAGPEPRAAGITAYNRDATGRLGSIHMYDNFDPATVPGVMSD